MPLSVNELSSALADIQSTNSPTEAKSNWADAFTDYFYDASVAGNPVEEGLLTSATQAMIGAMTAVNTDFPTAFQAGIVAFWGVVAASAATLWPDTAPPISAATPPPNLSMLAAQLKTVGSSNATSDTTKNNRSEAAKMFAGVIHPLMLGGTVTVASVPPSTVPIL